MSAESAIPRALVEELRYVEVSAARRFASPRPGGYTSPHRGLGLEFDRHRLYQPGDDVRRIDWNVTARLGAPFLRETHAERELDAVVLFDVSRSMELGTARHTKRDLSFLVAGSLLFSAAGDGVSTGMLAFGSDVLLYERPRRGRARAWQLLERMWAVPPAPGPTRLRPALAHLLRHLRRGAVLFLVSDFQAEDGAAALAELRVLAAHHDLLGVVIEDPAEETLPRGAGLLEVRDLESGRQRRVALTDRLRSQVAAAARRRRDDLSHRLYGVPMEHVFVRSREHVLEPVLQLLATRVRA